MRRENVCGGDQDATWHHGGPLVRPPLLWLDPQACIKWPIALGCDRIARCGGGGQWLIDLRLIVSRQYFDVGSIPARAARKVWTRTSIRSTPSAKPARLSSPPRRATHCSLATHSITLATS